MTRAEAVSPRGARALVLGLGRFGGGLGVARWLLAEGAQVTVTDRLPRQALEPSARQLERAGARLVLGGHEGLDPSRFDLLVVNPAVPQSAPLVQAARQAGTLVTSEMALVLERWPGPVLGVTGSNGKSTTVSLAAAVLQAAGHPAVAGGNLGGSLLPSLAQTAPGTIAVLELSSFMLEVTGPLGLGPDVAVITNITPNHLDRHGTWEAYRAAKAQVLVRARAAVLPGDDELGGPLSLPAGCARLGFGAAGSGAGPGAGRGAGPGVGRGAGPGVGRGAQPGAGRGTEPGWSSAEGRAVDLGVDERGDLVSGDGRRVLDGSTLAVPGRATRLDLAAAVLAASALCGDRAGVEAGLATALASWRPPRHRLELVVRRDGVAWVDDSASTTPESTAASVAAVSGPCLLIAGGRDKGLSPEALVAAAASGCRLVLGVGEQGAALTAALTARGAAAEDVGSLERAVAVAAARARPGDTVLLSPGYSSHDQFPHFEARAEAFATLVRALRGVGSAPLSPPAAGC